jgi:hypothetical protein
VITKPRIAQNLEQRGQWCVLLPPVGHHVGQLAVVTSFHTALKVLDAWLAWRRRVFEQRPFRASMPTGARLN